VYTIAREEDVEKWEMRRRLSPSQTGGLRNNVTSPSRDPAESNNFSIFKL